MIRRYSEELFEDSSILFRETFKVPNLIAYLMRVIREDNGAGLSMGWWYSTGKDFDDREQFTDLAERVFSVCNTFYCIGGHIANGAGAHLGPSWCVVGDDRWYYDEFCVMVWACTFPHGNLPAIRRLVNSTSVTSLRRNIGLDPDGNITTTDLEHYLLWATGEYSRTGDKLPQPQPRVPDED